MRKSERIIKDLIAALPKGEEAREEHIDEKPSHVLIEYQEHEEDFDEDLDDESIREFIHPPC
jgi:hypothetical protein